MSADLLNLAPETSPGGCAKLFRAMDARTMRAAISEPPHRVVGSVATIWTRPDRPSAAAQPAADDPSPSGRIATPRQLPLLPATPWPAEDLAGNLPRQRPRLAPQRKRAQGRRC